MRVQIKSVNGANLYDGEFNDLKTGVTAAVKSNADLRGADLRGADLHGADLYGANLCAADLRDTNLTRASLCLSKWG